MLKSSAVIFCGVFVLIMQPGNHAPVVTITAPANNSKFSFGARVHYSVMVSDKEDGDSRYDEINAKEVLLEVKYVTDQKEIKAFQKQNKPSGPAGLAAMRVSNCFSCHGFDNKLSGPSFRDISKKYKPASGTVLLSNSIRQGSSGIWGITPMPKHPELKADEIKNMVLWILQFSSHPEINYYTGTEGYFRLPADSSAQKNGVFFLTASYTDHGVDSFRNRLSGQNTILLQVR